MSVPARRTARAEPRARHRAADALDEAAALADPAALVSPSDLV
ncbi:hypothetical protein [Streptomyces phaeochromogenes]